MSKRDNIFLIGPMGAGKSSVGRQLARLTHYDFYDSDIEIEKRTGVSISWIFELESEAGFREREKHILDELTSLTQVVVSTGGGSIVTPENRTFLAERGFVAYLTVSLNAQLHRTSRHRGHRPLIDYPDAEQRLQTLNAERLPLYQSIADKTYETDGQSPRGIAYQIFEDFNQLYPG